MKNILGAILFIILGILIVLAVIGGRSLLSGQQLESNAKEFKNNDPAPSPTPTIVPTSSPTSSPTNNPTSIPTKIPSTKSQIIYEPTPTSLPTDIPIPSQPPQEYAPAISIELCRTKAETFKTQTMSALVLTYNQSNADAMKIANTSSVEELVNVGINIGLITSDQYNSDPNGHKLALLKTREKVMTEIKTFMDTVNEKGNLAYNDYYASCLTGGN